MQLHHYETLAFSDNLTAETQVRKESMSHTSNQGKIM